VTSTLSGRGEVPEPGRSGLTANDRAAPRLTRPDSRTCRSAAQSIVRRRPLGTAVRLGGANRRQIEAAAAADELVASSSMAGRTLPVQPELNSPPGLWSSPADAESGRPGLSEPAKGLASRFTTNPSGARLRSAPCPATRDVGALPVEREGGDDCHEAPLSCSTDVLARSGERTSTAIGVAVGAERGVGHGQHPVAVASPPWRCRRCGRRRPERPRVVARVARSSSPRGSADAACAFSTGAY
jgi:hypothetical protein